MKVKEIQGIQDENGEGFIPMESLLADFPTEPIRKERLKVLESLIAPEYQSVRYQCGDCEELYEDEDEAEECCKE